MRLDGDDGTVLKLIGALAEDEIGDLLDGGIDGAEEGDFHDAVLGESPGGSADQVADEDADDVDEQDGEQDTHEPGAEIVVAERAADVGGRFVGDKSAIAQRHPSPANAQDDLATDIGPEKIPGPDDDPEGDQRGHDSGEAAEEEAAEIGGES